MEGEGREDEGGKGLGMEGGGVVVEGLGRVMVEVVRMVKGGRVGGEGVWGWGGMRRGGGKGWGMGGGG